LSRGFVPEFNRETQVTEKLIEALSDIVKKRDFLGVNFLHLHELQQEIAQEITYKEVATMQKQLDVCLEVKDYLGAYQAQQEINALETGKCFPFHESVKSLPQYPALNLALYKNDGVFHTINASYPKLQAVHKDPWYYCHYHYDCCLLLKLLYTTLLLLLPLILPRCLFLHDCA